MVDTDLARGVRTGGERPLLGALVIVLTGIGLGAGYNWIGLESRPPRGLEWIARPKALESVEAAQTPKDAAGPAPRFGSAASNDPLGLGAPGTEDTALPVIPDLDRVLQIQLPAVKKFFDARAALFVDARETDEFAAGHIPGALSLPYGDAISDPSRLDQVDARGRPIIIYCGGGTCEASLNLGSALISQAGKRKVLVFMGGWPDWEGAGYPVERGASRSDGR